MSTPPLSFDDLLSAVASPAPVRFPVRSPAAAVAPAAASTPAPAEASSPAAGPAASSPAGKKRGPKKRAADAPKKKRGPKPKAEAELRTRCVSVWMNEKELAALDARRGHLARGERLRLAEASALPPAPASEINLQLHRQMASALSNLNQIAKALNTDRLSVEVEAALAEVRAFRNALIFPEALQRPGKKAVATKEPR